MIDIQERDRKILESIQDHRALLSGHIHKYFFKDVHESAARRRMKKLELAGLISRDYPMLYRGQTIIRLTRAGEAYVNANRAPDLAITKRFDPTTIEHDSIVASCRFRLQELWDGTWIPEAALKKEDFPRIPDGVLVFPNGYQAAVEVENTPKGPARFHKIQERWRSIKVRLVLYVATNPEMMKSVTSYLKTGPQNLPFGLVLWSELENGTPKVWTVAGPLDLFARRTL